MAITATDAWKALTVHERDVARASGKDGFALGFIAGWKAQENRPYHCMHCGFEALGATDGETIALAQDHIRECESHPLAIENRRLRAALDPMEAWASHALSIVKDRRIPSDDSVSDGEAIIELARQALTD